MSERKAATLKVIKADKDSWNVLISTGDVDRDSDTINPLGWQVDSYMKNPVVMWGHDYMGITPAGGVPIGKTTSLSITPEGPVATFEFRQPAHAGDFVNIVRSAWEQGILQAASVGFRPLKWSDRENGGRDFHEQELLEWSIVAIPANGAALRRSYETALKAAGMGALLKDDQPQDEAQPEAAPPAVSVDDNEAADDDRLALLLAEFLATIRELINE